MFSRSKSVDVARGRGVSLYPFQCPRANFIKGVYLITRSFFFSVSFCWWCGDSQVFLSG